MSGGTPWDGLPIAAVLPELLAALRAGPNAVLQAPPGAGKTTAVPLALLGEPWLAERKLVMLEPRRLAARAAARRMAALLGEEVGETVGYRIRFESRVGPRTRIEVVTDGVFTRMIQADPDLAGIGAVLFDEIHERRLDTDLGLALSLDAQAGLRPELRLLPMSATLDAGPLAELLGDAPILAAEGRAHPVEIRHLAAPSPVGNPAATLANAVAEAVRLALDEPGGILVFLPGGGEIRRAARRLGEMGLPADVDLLPLYGDLDAAAQDRALAPTPSGRRKLVLATAIAETSLTIDGIRQVVDAGLARGSRYDARTGLARLETGRASQAATVQRAGRAGRTSPGIAWRLWPEAMQRALPARTEPEIAVSDLLALALDLALWGVADPGALPLIDQPPPAHLAVARQLARRFGALDAESRLTAHGRRIIGMGIDPRLAHMILVAADQEEGQLAVLIAAALGETGLRRGRETDLRPGLERMLHPPPGDDAARRARDAARRLGRRAGIEGLPNAVAGAGAVLALAFPDRIAQRRGTDSRGTDSRGTDSRFLTAAGQGAALPEQDPLAASPFLVAADLDGQMPDARIWLAAPLSLDEIEVLFGEEIRWENRIALDPTTRTVRASRRRMLGAIRLGEAPLSDPPAEAVAVALLDAIRRRGLDILPWSETATALRRRLAFLVRQDGEGSIWPDVSDEALLAEAGDWLLPALMGLRGLDDLARLDLASLLRNRLDWNEARELDRRAPSHMAVPTGARIALDYAAETPVLAVKLQEMFGLAETPRIDDGRVPLVLHLLSPARRPIQVTSDLGGFWSGSYKAVRADLRGRYPRHPWPEDPLAALPTARAKPRGP